MTGRIEKMLRATKGFACIIYFYRGNIRHWKAAFADQRFPTACPHCAGSKSTIGLRSFLLKVSGVGSHSILCCTYLGSGFIIFDIPWFVHSQSAQIKDAIFVKNEHLSGQKMQQPCRFFQHTQIKAICLKKGEKIRKNQTQKQPLISANCRQK
jgi:hypothetical protein